MKKMNRGISGRALGGLATFLLYTTLAQAGSFSVNPVRVTLSANQSVAAITVRNESDEATVIQLETSSWTQRDGKDALESTTEILATPPILTLAPGAARIIRVGLRRVPDTERELTYRLFLREVPPPKPISQGLRVSLLVSMPVFVLPPKAPAPEVHWRAVRTPDGKIRVHARNSGGAHVQLGQLEIALATNSAIVATHGMSEYVLPDNDRSWVVDTASTPPIGALLRISSETDAGKVQSNIKLEDDARELTPAAANTTAR